jgi:FAD-dependent oxidoreductase family protein/S-layer family protein
VTKTYDVIVIGGSSAGVGAAVAAGRMGASVALIEDTPVLGGMLANGISNIDTFSLESLSGVFEEFRLAVQQHYRTQMEADPIFGSPAFPSPHVDGRSRQANHPRDGGRWEPHVADEIFKQMVAATPSVDVFYNRYPVDVLKEGNRVVGVVTEKSVGNHAYAPKTEGGLMIFRGRVIVDATHEADVAALAGAPYRVGREVRSALEPHAGDIRFFNGTGEIIDGSGEEDRAIVSYGVRLTVKIDPSPDHARLLRQPPPGYDPAKYEPGPTGSIYELNPTPSMPNSKAEMLANPIGNELQEVNWGWPEASRDERARLYELYRNHALGFLYYLQNAKGLTRLGLPEDEFVDNGNVPYRLFVREARRIVGEETMTEADVNPFVLSHSLLPPLRQDSIAIGHYAIDSKPVCSKTDLSTPDKGPGDFFLINASTAFQVPYGAIVPQEVDGLLVPAALSATHVAFSAVRMDPTWTALGQAAGVAAVVSVRQGVGVRDVSVKQVQRELLEQRVKLFFYWDLPADHPAFAAVQWLSVRGIVEGYPDRTFRSDQALTRAELAAMLFHGLGLWPSVSEVHFTDLPYDHWAFRYLETLFDRRALGAFGVRPLWPEVGAYDPGRHAWFATDQHDRFGEIKPDEPVAWGQAVAILHALDHHHSSLIRLTVERLNSVLAASEFGAGYSDRVFADHDSVERGDFCVLLAALRAPDSSLLQRDRGIGECQIHGRISC